MGRSALAAGIVMRCSETLSSLEPVLDLLEQPHWPESQSAVLETVPDPVYEGCLPVAHRGQCLPLLPLLPRPRLALPGLRRCHPHLGALCSQSLHSGVPGWKAGCCCNPQSMRCRDCAFLSPCCLGTLSLGILRLEPAPETHCQEGQQGKEG